MNPRPRFRPFILAAAIATLVLGDRLQAQTVLSGQQLQLSPSGAPGYHGVTASIGTSNSLVAWSWGSVAIGGSNTVLGQASLALGYLNEFPSYDNSYSIIVGTSNSNGGVASAVFGTSNRIEMGQDEGLYLIAENCFIAGRNNVISSLTGDPNPSGWVKSASVFGAGLINYWSDSMVVGRYNNANPSTTPLFVIGNGTNASTRSNAVEISTNSSLFLNLLTAQAGVTVGGGATASELRFLEPNSGGTVHSTAFKAQAQGGDITYTLPAAAPAANGQVLTSTTTGALTWTSAPTGNGLEGTGPLTFTAGGTNSSINLTTTGTGKVVLSSDADINGVTVGRGGGASAANVAVGNGAFAANTTGLYNVAVGHVALAVNTTGQRNVAVGSAALAANTTGQYNVAVGEVALATATTASANTALGAGALLYNTASGNTSVGYYSLSSNTTGEYNTAVGTFALGANTTGIRNTAVGNGALVSSTTGEVNTALGLNTLYYNTTGGANTALGVGALTDNIDAWGSVAVGEGALRFTNANCNIGLGQRAGRVQADGTTPLALLNSTGSTGNIYIGADTRGFNNNDANAIVIGYTAIGEGANKTVIGTPSTDRTHTFGSLLIGGGTTAAELRILQASGSGSYYTGFQAPTGLIENVVYTLPPAKPTTNGQVLKSTTDGVLSWSASSGGGGEGTVTSVTLAVGTTGLTISGNSSQTIVEDGTFTLGGTLDVDNGGTGQSSFTNGQLLIGNSTGNTLTKATLTAGSNIAITNGTGSITISVTGLAASATTDTTDASNIASGTLSATRLPAFSGDVTTGAGTSVTAIANNAVNSGKIADGSILDADISGSAAILGSKIDINGLTEDTNPDADNDFVMTYDASVAPPINKKVKLSNLPGGGGGGSGNATQLQSRDVSNAAPSEGQALIWNSTTSKWTPATTLGGAGLVRSSTNAAQVVVGQFNDTTVDVPNNIDKTVGTFIIGAGTGVGTPSQRRNAMRVLDDGSGTILINPGGDIPMTGFEDGPQP